MLQFAMVIKMFIAINKRGEKQFTFHGNKERLYSLAYKCQHG